ncbi:golgin subfamily B member 1-like isoform X2 [Microtus pennsylvanicus]|uniref:golgin subfamily B member 1-like isoform X2 n=1 Tax=Microtus pennsylvanicus TaxID=10058 RepID=UPI003F6AEBF4
MCLQLSSMQQMVHEKDARFETQVRLHEDELLPLVTQADVETEMQQLEELKTLQQQYLLRNQEVIELLPLKAQLQEYQEQAETMQMMQEELRRESLAWQQELHQLRMEKSTWELHEKWMKEQYIMAIADKDEQLGHLQSLLRSSSQIPILSAQYQRQGEELSMNCLRRQCHGRLFPGKHPQKHQSPSMAHKTLRQNFSGLSLITA